MGCQLVPEFIATILWLVALGFMARRQSVRTVALRAIRQKTETRWRDLMPIAYTSCLNSNIRLFPSSGTLLDMRERGALYKYFSGRFQAAANLANETSGSENEHWDRRTIYLNSMKETLEKELGVVAWSITFRIDVSYQEYREDTHLDVSLSETAAKLKNRGGREVLYMPMSPLDIVEIYFTDVPFTVGRSTAVADSGSLLIRL